MQEAAAAAKEEKRNKDRIKDLTVTINKAADALIFKNNRREAEACFKVLVLMIGNIAEHPKEAKYRQIKSRNKLISSVLDVEGVRDFLVLVGGLIKVVNFEEHWVFESNAVNDEKISLAAPILKTYQKKLDGLIERETRQTDRKKQEEETRQRTALQFRDDREMIEERVERDRVNRLIREQQAKEKEERLKLQKLIDMEREAADRSSDPTTHDQSTPGVLIQDANNHYSQETESDLGEESDLSEENDKE